MNVLRAAYTADHSSGGTVVRCNAAFGQLAFSGLTPLQKAAPPLRHYESLGFLEAYVRDNYRHRASAAADALVEIYNAGWFRDGGW